MLVIGYTYDADTHCLDCTRHRFGDALDTVDARDSDGNPPHPMFSTDESPPTGEWCGTCGGCIDSPWPDADDDDLAAFGYERETYDSLKALAKKQYMF